MKTRLVFTHTKMIATITLFVLEVKRAAKWFEEVPMSKRQTIQSFTVAAGNVYVLKVKAQHDGQAGVISIAQLTCRFWDAQDRPVDPRLSCDPGERLDLEAVSVEVFADAEVRSQADESFRVTRFILIPPDAVRLELSNCDASIQASYTLEPLSAAWWTSQARDTLDTLKTQITANIDHVMQTCLDIQPEVLTVMETPLRQFEALMSWFASGGDWSRIMTQLQDMGGLQDFHLRMSRITSQAIDPLPVIGFVGSERGRERLLAYAHLVWLREDQLAEQLHHMDFDAVVIETSLASGAEGDAWALAFSSLTGDLPAAGARLYTAVAAAEVPIHIWLTGDPAAAPLWREAIARADRVIAEGEGWTDIPFDECVPVATELAACSLAVRDERDLSLMLIPTASDLFQYPDFERFVKAGSLYQTLLTEFRYAFSLNSLKGRLGEGTFPVINDIARPQQRQVLQAANLVLLPAQSLRSDVELAQLAMDAIASGAIPVMYGAPRGTDALLGCLDVVQTPESLVQLQGLYRITWFRERRWRLLMDHVVARHLWAKADRTAVLGYDAMGATFDRPRVSVVLVTKRPHFLQKCIMDFRRQTWPNTELIIVFNTGILPADLPVLQDNERAFALPEAANIGECLNRGIALATGRIWCKMDDDDFYSDRYLADTVTYYRSTQADIVGRQAAFFYFSGPQETVVRSFVNARSFALVNEGDTIAGATLSATVDWTGPLFSTRYRNTADAQWVIASRHSGARMFSGGVTDMVIYRDAVEENHTWKMSTITSLKDRYMTCASYNLFDAFERGQSILACGDL